MCVASNIVEGWDSSKQQPRASAFTNIPWQPLFRRSIYFSLNCWKMKLPSFTGSYTTPSFMNNLWCPTLRLRFEESHLQWWDKKKKQLTSLSFIERQYNAFFPSNMWRQNPYYTVFIFITFFFFPLKSPCLFSLLCLSCFSFASFCKASMCAYIYMHLVRILSTCVLFFFFFFCVSLLERCWQFERSVPCFPFGSFGFAGLLSSLFFLVCSFLWPYI